MCCLHAVSHESFERKPSPYLGRFFCSSVFPEKIVVGGSLKTCHLMKKIFEVVE